MNYLGHLLVVPDRGLLTLGNLLGDFVKGRLDQVQPIEFRLGLQLHRELDGFADSHPLTIQSRTRVSPARRRIAGVLVDIFYDHFLAPAFDPEPHRAALLPFAPHLPPTINHLPDRLLSSRWLGSYRTVDGIAAVLAQMERRRPRPLGLLGAEEELTLHYDLWREEALAFHHHARAHATARATQLLLDLQRHRV